MTLLVAIALMCWGAETDTGLPGQQLAPGVYVVGSSHQFGGANVGWVICDDHVALIGPVHARQLTHVLNEVRKVTEKPVRTAVFTHIPNGAGDSARALAGKGIEVIVPREGAIALRGALDRAQPAAGAASQVRIREFGDPLVLRSNGVEMEILAQGRIRGPGDAVVYLPRQQVLFAGALCIHGPRAELAGTDTLKWLSALRRLKELPCRTVVPGYGSIGGPTILEREEQFLRELRRQVGHLVAQGRTLEGICKEVRITPGYLVWMPYDQPICADIEHVYRELTVPLAPFGNPDEPKANSSAKALVLIADGPHDPQPIEDGLGKALRRADVTPFITVDVHALTAENLKEVQLLVILRDGAIWPHGRDRPAVTWMTPAQEAAIVEFVERGGGLLALHNAIGLYPEGGPYVRLVGGTFQGHGPLERFRVTVVDPSHPVTRGVAEFEVADEQHTPVPDRKQVHLLLQSQSAEGTTGAAGWVRQAGRGRVCYLANGHTREALEHPQFQKLLRNAARWCLGKDDGVSSMP